MELTGAVFYALLRHIVNMGTRRLHLTHLDFRVTGKLLIDVILSCLVMPVSIYLYNVSLSLVSQHSVLPAPGRLSLL